MESITQMLDATRAGDRAAGERLFSAVYSELKVIARSQRRRWVGNHTINTGETFTLSGVPCAAYDVRVVDEDGDECIIEDVGLCATKDTWVITDKDLLGCQAATQGE